MIFCSRKKTESELTKRNKICGRSRKRKSDKKAEQAQKRIASEEEMFLALSRKYVKLQDYTAELTRLLCDTRSVLYDCAKSLVTKGK